MKVTVIYPKDSLSPRSGYRSEDRAMEYELPVPDSFCDLDICEVAFRYANSVDGGATEDQLRAHKDRSMMVGDLVQVRGEVYRCEVMGFKKVGHFEPAEGVKP